VKRWFLVEVVCGAMLIAVAGCSVGSGNKSEANSAVGRYQIAAGDPGVYLVDTTNGHVWLHDKNTSTGWADLSSPSSPAWPTLRH